MLLRGGPLKLMSSVVQYRPQDPTAACLLRNSLEASTDGSQLGNSEIRAATTFPESFTAFLPTSEPVERQIGCRADATPEKIFL